MYFYGCENDETGHYFFASDSALPKHRVIGPWGYDVDGRLQPDGPQREGVALVHHKDGWTALAFWDRSVDRRGGSSSTFLCEGTYAFDEMVEKARAAFPAIWARYRFPVVEAVEREPQTHGG